MTPKELKERLSPEWILDCVMVEDNHTLVIAPRHCFEKGIGSIKITSGDFGSGTVLNYRIREMFEKKKHNPTHNLRKEKKP